MNIVSYWLEKTKREVTWEGRNAGKTSEPAQSDRGKTQGSAENDAGARRARAESQGRKTEGRAEGDGGEAEGRGREIGREHTGSVWNPIREPDATIVNQYDDAKRLLTQYVSLPYGCDLAVASSCGT